ncbi:MAG: hypothetical protein M3R71_03445 [Actinomycetota bacterium]|nr:hypothetical protein [Actinomycetota bacterium]
MGALGATACRLLDGAGLTGVPATVPAVEGAVTGAVLPGRAAVLHDEAARLSVARQARIALGVTGAAPS